MIRILLVDDQNLVQQGIKSLFAQDPEIEVIGTVKDGRSAVMQINELHPDIVLLDIEMPGMDGITATKYITHLAPQTKVIILSSHEDKKYLTQALMAGAKAYILKTSLMRDLKESIIAVNNGFSHIESRLLAKIFDPSNLKLNNSRKPRPQHSQSSKSQKHRSLKRQIKDEVGDSVLKSAPMFPDRPVQADLSDAVILDRPDRSMHPSGNVSPLQTSKSVPKINLPDSDLEPANSSTPLIERNSSMAVGQMLPPTETNKKLLPSTVAQSSASQSSATEKKHGNKTFMVMVNGKNYMQQIAKRPAVAKYQAELSRFWAGQTRRYTPLFNRCRHQLTQYWAKTKTVTLFKQWDEKGWLTNLGWASLGLITVIIIHQVFS